MRVKFVKKVLAVSIAISLIMLNGCVTNKPQKSSDSSKPVFSAAGASESVSASNASGSSSSGSSAATTAAVKKSSSAKSNSSASSKKAVLSSSKPAQTSPIMTKEKMLLLYKTANDKVDNLKNTAFVITDTLVYEGDGSAYITKYDAKRNNTSSLIQIDISDYDKKQDKEIIYFDGKTIYDKLNDSQPEITKSTKDPFSSMFNTVNSLYQSNQVTVNSIKEQGGYYYFNFNITNTSEFNYRFKKYGFNQTKSKIESAVFTAKIQKSTNYLVEGSYIIKIHAYIDEISDYDDYTETNAIVYSNVGSAINIKAPGFVK